MKKTVNFISLIFIFLLHFSLSQAQEMENGAFIAPVFKYSTLNSRSALISGIKGGWVINKSLVIGAGFYKLSSTIYNPLIDQTAGNHPILDFSYGGIELEYIFFADEPLHFSLDLIFAGSGVSNTPQNSSKPYTPYFSNDLLVWEPGLNIEYNLLKWLHLDLGVSFRSLMKKDAYYGLNEKDFYSWNGLFMIKFGSY